MLPTVRTALPRAECVETHESPILFPVHVVHPEDGTPRLWNVYCEAVCPTCGARWRHNPGIGRPEIIG